MIITLQIIFLILLGILIFVQRDAVKQAQRTVNYVEELADDIDLNLNEDSEEALQYYTTSEYGLTRAHDTDAGMDIYSNEEFVLHPKERHFFKTGIHLAIPKGNVVNVRPRSGLAYKSGIDILAGVVDEPFTGEVKVGLINHSSQPIEIKVGDKIAQLVMQKVNQKQPKSISKDLFDIIAKMKDRQDKAFGSSDVKKENK